MKSFWQRVRYPCNYDSAAKTSGHWRTTSRHDVRLTIVQRTGLLSQALNWFWLGSNGMQQTINFQQDSIPLVQLSEGSAILAENTFFMEDLSCSAIKMNETTSRQS